MSEAGMPALYDHCVQIYDAMFEDADLHNKDNPDPEQRHFVWEGFLTKLFTDQGFSVPYYTSVRSALMRMDCIRQIRRGGGTAPSQWLLVQKPTPELWNAYATSTGVAERNKTKMSKTRMLEQRINDLHKRVSALEEAQGATA